jgi:TrmH family RNA methyltransferase
MATETNDYTAVLQFIDRIKANDCFIGGPDAPGPLRDEHNLPELIPYLDIGLTADDNGANGRQSIQAFATGWTNLEGVMLITPEREYDADLRVSIAADTERALRDLLLAFPPGKVGFCYLSGDWMLPTLAEILTGFPMPAREGYYASEQMLTPVQDFPTRRLSREDYNTVQAQWSESVWQEICDGGYSVYTCQPGAELGALCFHWPVSPWRNEVHGLQAVQDYALPYAESVVSAATSDVIAQGKIATCTANLSNQTDYLNAFRRVGYRPFCRVPSYLGIKRGSGTLEQPSPKEFYAMPGRHSRPVRTASRLGEGRRIAGSKDPLLVQAADLMHAAGRRERSQFVIEGVLLAQRALHDGQPIAHLLYTSDLLAAPEGMALLSDARQAGVNHSLVTDGLMAKVTTTRPVPPALAIVFAPWRSADRFRLTDNMAILAAENINNPDNLGMILRTADAAGIDAVIVAGEKSDPFHKNCVRAARGAVGRFPVLHSQSLPQSLSRLQSGGFIVAGAALQAESELFQCSLPPPIAIVVGNEQSGISKTTLDACTTRVRIPMAPGQDSLNVGVAAGLLLYEVIRQQRLT